MKELVTKLIRSLLKSKHYQKMLNGRLWCKEVICVENQLGFLNSLEFSLLFSIMNINLLMIELREESRIWKGIRLLSGWI